MGVYIIGFALSVFLIYFAESKRFTGKWSKLAVFIALLIPCLIAGLRDRTIGTDVYVYAEPLLLTAQSSESFFEFLASGFSINSWSYSEVKDFEIGFVILSYLSARMFNSLPVLLFSVQAFTVIPIYKGLRAFGKTQPVWLGMAVYYLMFFNQTLNMMRQWIAMAFLFYGFQFLEKKQYRKYFLTMLVAVLFHNTAILGLAIIFVYWLVARENTYNRKIKAILLILIGLVSLLSLDFFVKILNWLGLRYDNYISGSLEFMPRQILYRIPIMLMLLLRWKYLKRTDRLANFYVVMVAYDLLAAQLTSIFAHSLRISAFCSEYYMLAYPAICMASDNKKNRQVLKLFVLCYLCVYWWYVYAYGGSSATVPYVSIFG